MRKSKKGKHKTLDKKLELSVQWLQKFECVKKVIINRTEGCRHAYAAGHMRVKSDVEGGIKINGYGGRGVTDLFVRIEPIKDRDRLKNHIEDKFN